MTYSSIGILACRIEQQPVNTSSQRDTEGIGDQIRPKKAKAKDKTEQADGAEVVQPSWMKELGDFDEVGSQ